jgi:hypothetical protein
MKNGETGLQLRSLVKTNGELELSPARVAIPEPGADEVVVRVEASQRRWRLRWREHRGSTPGQPSSKISPARSPPKAIGSPANRWLQRVGRTYAPVMLANAGHLRPGCSEPHREAWHGILVQNGCKSPNIAFRPKLQTYWDYAG